MFCELQGVEKRYDGRAVLEVPELRLEAGAITAVIGPNGSGKTTLLEILALLTAPDQGRVRLWGRAATPADRHLRESVVLAMHPGFLFRGTVGRNVLYGLRARGVGRREARRRGAEALETVGLAGLARRGVEGLSAGERQRVNLARAMALRPKALLLDEPTANVDAACMALVRRVMGELRDSAGVTLVHSSPAPNGLEAISDRTVALEAGRVVGDG